MYCFFLQKQSFAQTGPFALTPERQSVVDYSQDVYVDNDIFIVGLRIDKDPWALMRPFEWEVWLGILITIPIFWSFTGIANFLYSGDAKWSSTAFFTFALMLSQMSNVSMQTKWYKRIYLIVWVWFCLVLTKCYSGPNMFTKFD